MYDPVAADVLRLVKFRVLAAWLNMNSRVSAAGSVAMHTTEGSGNGAGLLEMIGNTIDDPYDPIVQLEKKLVVVEGELLVVVMQLGGGAQ